MYKSLNNYSPKVFQNKFKSVNHKYPTLHSQENLAIPRFNLKSTRFSISYRGPYLWNIDAANVCKCNIYLMCLERYKHH